MAGATTMMDNPLMRSPRAADSIEEFDILDAEDSMFEADQGVMEFEIEGENPQMEFDGMPEQMPEEAMIHDSNLAMYIDDTDLSSIATKIENMVADDKSSREDWEDTYTKGLKLLGLKYDERSEPFQGASGVSHPVLNEAANQFSSMAYKELIPSSGPVNTKVLGKSSQIKEDRALRVKNFLNWQLMDQMEEFEPEFDQMLYYNGLAGSTFKKTYIDPELQRPVSRFVMPEHLIVPYTATDLDTTPRATHVITMEKRRIMRLQLQGFYAEADLSSGSGEEADSIKDVKDELEGIQKTSYTEEDDNDELTLHECYCYLDLEDFPEIGPDGEPTGIALPYIVTTCSDSNEVLGIRRNWDEGDADKKQKKWFTHYKFTPGLGFYGFGLIHLIGSLAHGATSTLRQLIDAGTLANLPSGFKAKGIRVENKDEALVPGEWRDVDAPGGSLRDALMPLPYKGADQTLFALLGFIVQASEKFIGTTDLGLTSGAEVPVGTAMMALEKGTRVVSAVHKRMHSSFRKELKLIAGLFGQVQSDYPYEPTTGTPDLFSEDFGPEIDIIPVSDPNIFSMSQRIMLAQEQLKLAQGSPEIHNVREAYRRMYVALGIDNVDEIMPKEDEPQPTSPAAENAKVPLIINMGAEPLKAFPDQSHDLHIKAHTLYLQTPIVKSQKALYAIVVQHIYEHIAVWSEQLVMAEIGEENPEWAQQKVQAEAQMEQNPEGVPPELPPPPIKPEEMEKRIAQKNIELMKQFSDKEHELFGGEIPSGGDILGLKQQEITNVKQDKKDKNELKETEIALQSKKHADTMKLGQDRINSTEDIADLRAATTMAKSNKQGGGQ